jgi:hypothetical protein
MPASQLLAATIVFTGLILHFQTDTVTNAKRAVIVDAKPSHQPRLFVSDRQRVSDSGNWTIVQMGRSGPNARPWVYDLSNTRLKVVGASGAVTESTRFQDFVPRLPEVLNGTDALLPDVRSGAANVAIAAYLEYSGGLLDVPICYKAAALYSPPLPGGPRCVAREVDFTPAVNTNWEIQDVDDPTHKIVFASNALVQIKNDSTTRGQHQKHYGHLLAGGTTVRDVTDSDLECTPQCTLIGILPSRGPSVECSNNQWP